MTENEQKQQLSFAYVHAVAARAGFACDRPSVDDDSVDVVIGASGLVNGKSLIRSPRVEILSFLLKRLPKVDVKRVE